jgi:hypothetical protein
MIYITTRSGIFTSSFHDDPIIMFLSVKSVARRSQSMPEHALKAAIRTNNTSGNDTDEEDDLVHKQNGMKNNFGKSTTPKVDKSRSRLVRQQDLGSRIH